MYRPIQLSDHRKSNDITEKVSLNIFNESEEETNVFTEAVFINGKEKIVPLLESFTKIKDDFESKLSTEKNGFEPEDFWRSPNFKILEEQIKNIFGFRYVSIEPYIEKYNKKDNTFESGELNCCVYRADRYPIDGVVTDSGFYDESHSLVMHCYISLGLVHLLTAEEILAVFLHEFGHGIDPASMTISYADANILSKYITDRNKEITDAENKVVKNKFKIISKYFNPFKRKMKGV